jgi:uncharacterized BrkB/YihY/UPF0761 family membrane protein
MADDAPRVDRLSDSTADVPVADPSPNPTEDAPTPAAKKPSFVKRSVDSMKARADGVIDDLERRRAHVPIIDVAFRGVEHDVRTGGGILAGAVAFRFFLFVVPYVFVVVFAFGLGAEAADAEPTELARKTGIVGLAASAIEASTDVSRFTQIVTLSIALWALVSGARTLLKSVFAVHSLIWGVPLVKVKKVTQKALAAIVLSTSLIVVVRLVAAIQHTSVTLWVLSMVLLVIVPAGVWLVLTNKVFPSAPGTDWSDLWPGALLFGIGVQLLHVTTVVWIARSLESKSETYGALGAALTILLWAYLLGRLVTASASLSSVLWEDKQRKAQPAPPSPDG